MTTLRYALVSLKSKAHFHEQVEIVAIDFAL